MFKKKSKFSVTKNGRPLNKRLYNWDERTKTFSTEENDLVLDFRDVHGTVFKTGSYCTFTTGPSCTFKTDYNCVFKTGSYCTFTTGLNCTFITGSNCIFTTGSNCTFDTMYHCEFKTGSNCTFDTGHSCTFNTSFDCIFRTGFNCIFRTGKNCIVIRRDVYEVIELEKDFNHIILNEFGVFGYKEILPNHTIIIDGEEIQISHESYENMKKHFLKKGKK